MNRIIIPPVYVRRRIALNHGELLFDFVWIVMIAESTVIVIAICVGVFFDCSSVIRIM